MDTKDSPNIDFSKIIATRERTLVISARCNPNRRRCCGATRADSRPAHSYAPGAKRKGRTSVKLRVKHPPVKRHRYSPNEHMFLLGHTSRFSCLKVNNSPHPSVHAQPGTDVLRSTSCMRTPATHLLRGGRATPVPDVLLTWKKTHRHSKSAQTYLFERTFIHKI